MRKLCVFLAFLLLAACKRDAAAADPKGEKSAGEPTTSEVDELVSGAGQLRLGISESAAIAALGQPTRRQDPASPGASTDLLWEHLPGAHPGNAMARFFDHKLTYMEVAPLDPGWPSVSRTAAQSLTDAEVVQRAVAGKLPISEVVSVAGKPGAVAMMTIVRGEQFDPNKIVVRRTFAWQIEPGSHEFLVVNEEGGRADQPVMRTTS